MPKQALSVTLTLDNVAWLKGRAAAARGRSVSELLDQLVTAARKGQPEPSRSVMGTIDIDPADPNLDSADMAVRALFDKALNRRLVVREDRPGYRARTPRRKPRG